MRLCGLSIDWIWLVLADPRLLYPSSALTLAAPQRAPLMDILHFAQQRVLGQQGRSVVRCLLHATKIAPDSPHAWQLLAHVHMNEMGRPAEAVKYLRGAIKATPLNVDYWLALAQVRTPPTAHTHQTYTSRAMRSRVALTRDQASATSGQYEEAVAAFDEYFKVAGKVRCPARTTSAP